MTTAKAPRVMTAKGFLHKSNGNVSALAFLAAHREFLSKGTLGQLTSPVLIALDKGEILPTPALNEIRNLVMSHGLAVDIHNGQKAMAANQAPKTRKAYEAVILDGNGKICTKTNDEGEEKDLVQAFDDGISAEGWCDRRLFDGAPDWHGTITHQVTGERVVLREDSIARILRQPVKAAMSKKGSPNTANKMRVKGDHQHFSKG